MNIVYYLVSSLVKDKNVGLSGGHGYTYDQTKESSRKLIKDTPSGYGYFVNGSYQSIPVEQVMILNGRGLRQETDVDAFLAHLIDLLEYAERENAEKVLIIHDSVNGQKLLENNKVSEKFADNNYVKRARELYGKLKGKIIFDLEYYAKGGEGPKQAHKQMELAQAMLELPIGEPVSIDIVTVKEYKNPENDFNKVVTASRWFFNTGDKSEFYNIDENGYRRYEFGRIDPQKAYYGKATPDVFYSALFTKTPIVILDKLYDFCKAVKPNPLNLLAAADVGMVKSKEISRVIDTIPGTLTKNDLKASMSIAGVTDPVLVNFIDPPGLSYRIKDFQYKLKMLHSYFMRRDENNQFQKQHFLDITDKFFEQDAKGKWKIHSDFTNNTLTVPIMIDAPGCVKQVKINLAIRYDIPERNALNSIINNKITDFKVWIGLDFNDDAGVMYYTVIQTPDFNLVHCNSCASLRVYNLKELGKAK